jgi:spore coat protein CotF
MKTFSEKELLNAVLSQHKLLATSTTQLVLESSNQTLRNDATTILQNIFKNQKQIFDLMSQKGWYTIEAASRQDIDKARQQLTSAGQMHS